MTLLLPAFRVFLSLLWMGLVGWAIIRLFSPDLERAEKIAWGFAFALLLRAAIYGGLLLFRAGPGAWKLFAVEALVLLGSLLARPDSGSPIPRKRLATLPRLILGFALIFILVGAVRFLSQPLWASDYMAIWGLKAKTIFFSNGIPGRVFGDPLTVWSHPEYPLLVPLSMASLAASIGGFDDRAIALLFSAFQLATTLAVFGFLRRRACQLPGAIGALLTAAFVPLYQPGNGGMGDIPIAFGFVLLGTAYCDALAADRPAAHIRLLLASLFCVTTKQEGSLLVLLLAIAFFPRVFRRQGRVAIAAEASLLLPLALQVAVTRILTGGAPRPYLDTTLLGHWGRWWPRILETLSHLVSTELAAAAVPVAALLVFFGVTRRGAADGLLAPIAVLIGAYVALMSLSAYGVDWLFETAFPRLMSALVPLVLLVASARLVEQTRSQIRTTTGES